MAGFDFDFSQAEQATKKQARLRMALHGASGCGKTYSALAVASHLGERIFCLDSEHGSSVKYAPPFVFQTLPKPLPDFHPERLISFLDKGPDLYDVLIVDSSTHFWNGPRGFLALVDERARSKAANGGKFDSFGAWKDVDPLYQRLVHSVHTCRAHVIFTMRAKTEYSKDEKGKIQKLGLAPQMRDDFQYEMDVEGMLTIDHDLVIGKTRCPDLDGKVFNKPGKDVADILRAWLNDGAAPATSAPQPAGDPEWFADALSAIRAADSEDELKAAQQIAVDHKNEMTPHLRGRLVNAVRDAKVRMAQAQEAPAAQ